MRTKKRWFEACTQIFILLVATVAFSYLMHEGYGEEGINNKNKEDKGRNSSDILLFLLRVVNKLIWNEKTIVSASGVVQTCMNTKDGRNCVEYLSSECKANCNEDCIPIRASDISECKIGTCYDGIEGTCSSGTNKKTCESALGKWLDDTNGNVQECKKGCCVAGSETKFKTARECARIGENLGIETTFKPEVNRESECILSAVSEEEGACLLGKDAITGKYECKFVTRSSCNSFRGDFHAGILCSNSELNTKCERQKTTNCIEGKAEIYWFDSCGNRENIYSAGLTSWNNGMVLSKQDSCSLGSGNNLFSNQRTCGNCNYFAGSACGAKTNDEYLSDGTQKVVCKKLNCEAGKNGITNEMLGGKNERAHGESWCAYQGDIGVKGEKQRAIDTPGSSHFREICAYGEIRQEPCASARSQICVENKASANGKTFSTSACVPNVWQNCINYNSLENHDEALQKCSEDQNCFVKSVGVSKGFDFSVCTPKYPAGFDMELYGESAGSVCSIASQKCTSVYVKKYNGRWKCIENCECRGWEFTKQMNDLCMSLGDCGASVNYQGTLTTRGYSILGAPGLDSNYLNEISRYSEPISGKSAEIGNLTNIINSFGGIPNNFGEISEEQESGLQLQERYGEEFLTSAGAISGVFGMLTQSATWLGLIHYTAQPLAYFEMGGQGYSIGAAQPTAWASLGVAAGAAAGFAAVYFALTGLGISRGLNNFQFYALVTLGTAGGALAAGGLLYGEQGIFGIGASTGPIGWVTLAVVAIIIAVLKFSGVGKTKTEIAEFRCSPWQPPRGGADCNKCGKDGFPCSKYACQSLGSTCQFKNEGTKEEICLDISPNDISPPVISPGEISEGYEFSNKNELGVQLKSKEGEGCIPAFAPIKFGIELSDSQGKAKAGACEYSPLPFDMPVLDSNFGDDEFTDEQFANYAFGARDFDYGLIKENHSATIFLPSAESLGLPAYDPNKRTDYNIYIRCENANGYENKKDYVINMCVKPGKDITPPLITKIAEPAGRFIKYGIKEQTLKLFTNEPADCRWSATDNAYDNMENKMSCANELAEQKLFGWGCSSSVPVVKDKSTFYLRCQDKPWEENESSRNKNSESKILTFEKTPKLEIISAKPDNETLTFSTSAGSVKIEATTRGGMSTGANCLASFDGKNYLVNLNPNLEGNVHSVIMQSFTTGNKKVWLKCEDNAGNSALKTIAFDVEIDTTPPSITGLYYDAGRILAITNEPSNCAISESECMFKFNNGTLMSGEGREHSAEISTNKLYYIKCKDRYGNEENSCDKQIKVV